MLWCLTFLIYEENSVGVGVGEWGGGEKSPWVKVNRIRKYKYKMKTLKTILFHGKTVKKISFWIFLQMDSFK